jgi:ferric-dicitrate binding protein FerR (iron transport regulator)
MAMGSTTWSLSAPVAAAERAMTAATETHRAASTAHQDELRRLERALDDARLEAAAASGRVGISLICFTTRGVC